MPDRTLHPVKLHEAVRSLAAGRAVYGTSLVVGKTWVRRRQKSRVVYKRIVSIRPSGSGFLLEYEDGSSRVVLADAVCFV